jgi:archaellum component FlaF (FlaF/FlaG flagellin family)
MRNGLSPVIASVILSGMVLVIGAGVWSYSYGAASVMANDYADETIDMVHTIIERFTIEKVYYDSSAENITIFVYNYGDVSVEVDTTIKINETFYYDSDKVIDPKDFEKICIDVSEEGELSSLQKVSIDLRTKSENREYMTYYVP